MKAGPERRTISAVCSPIFLGVQSWSLFVKRNLAKLANFAGNLANVGEFSRKFGKYCTLASELVDFGMSIWVISAQIRQMCPLFRVTKGLQLWTPKYLSSWQQSMVKQEKPLLQCKSLRSLEKSTRTSNAKTSKLHAYQASKDHWAKAKQHLHRKSTLPAEHFCTQSIKKSVGHF